MKLIFLCLLAVIALVSAQTLDKECSEYTDDSQPNGIGYECPPCPDKFYRTGPGETCEDCSQVTTCETECPPDLVRVNEFGCCAECKQPEDTNMPTRPNEPTRPHEPTRPNEPTKDEPTRNEPTRDEPPTDGPIHCSEACDSTFTCPDGQEPFIKEGECCPQDCRPQSNDCDAIECADVICVDDVVPVMEGCCPVCKERDQCSDITCSQPLCEDDEFSTVVHGECCPVCKKKNDCSKVDCPAVECPPDFKPVKREGECCERCERPTCNTLVECPALECAEGTERVLAEGACCPTCRPKLCKEVCPAVVVTCKEGYRPGLSENGCCRTECVPADDICSHVRCPAVECDPDFQEETFGPLGCCRVCKRKCDTVKCADVKCADGSTPIKEDGACCATRCEKNCNDIMCPDVMCDEPGQEQRTVPGRCCDDCILTTNVCHLKTCPEIKCAANEGQYIAPGECCPSCRPFFDVCDADIMCADPICPENSEVYQPETSCCKICRRTRGIRISRDTNTTEFDYDVNTRDEYEAELIALIKKCFEEQGRDISLDEFEIIIEESDGRKVAHVSFTKDEDDTEFRTFVESDTSGEYTVDQIISETSNSVVVASAIAVVALVALF